MGKKYFFILIIFLALILITVWFKNGNILGTAEDGLIFYNLTNYYHQSEHTWMEYPGLGSPSFTLLAGKPTFFIMSLLQQAGIPGFLIQAGVFWLIFISAAIGVYLLEKEFFPELPLKYIFLSVLFYWFNPISLADVWNRFLLNYIFFFGLMPLGTYFYLKGLRSKQYIWVIIFNLALFFYSYAFSYVAFVMLLWLWLTILTIEQIIFYRNQKSIFFCLKYLLSSLIVFVLVNSWWVLPLIKLNSTGASIPTTKLFISQDNLNILKALSNSVGKLTDIFRLSNGSFLSTDSLNWVKIYYLLFAIPLYIITATLFYLFIKRRNEKSVLFWIPAFFLLAFLMKGSNPPFGEIYLFIFKKIHIFQVFRNPFEKFGFIFSLIISILIGMSMYNLQSLPGAVYRKLVYPFFLIFILVGLGFPFYSGLVLTNKFPPTNNYSVGYQVKVPDYYKEVNNYLTSKGTNFRILGLPIKDEGITYNWEKGYAGVELTVALYDSKGIFLNTSTPFFNKIVPAIEPALLTNKRFDNLANALNVRYYLLRTDIDYRLRNLTDPGTIEKKLLEKEIQGEVKKIGQFGRVSVWENLKWTDRMFTIVKKLVAVDNFNNADLTEVNVATGEALIDSDGLSKVKKVISLDKQQSAGISYQKINSTEYEVNINGSSGPILLNFAEDYNNGWQASYEDGQTINNHLLLNIYANAWIVNRKGDFKVRIKFIPEDWIN